MIRTFDDPAGGPSPKFNPRAMLQKMERYLSHSKLTAGTKAEEAQELVYDAWEAETLEQQEALILSALELDPANVDALLQVALYAGMDGPEEIEFLRKVVATGKKNLGKKLKEFEGHFWGFLETRPYMRARERLAEAWLRAGRPDEAIDEWNGMLKLNPNDNQGVRYLLLPVLLMQGRLEPARELFKKYAGEQEFNTVFAWCRVLERFLTDDLAGAQTALAAAGKQNPHTQAYVKGHRNLPKHLPESYSMGSREEAICCAESLRQAWVKHPEALKWLEKQKVK